MKRKAGILLVLLLFSFAYTVHAVTLEDSKPGGTIFVGQKTCTVNENCPGTNEYCFCSRNECRPCNEGFICSNHACVENRSIEILEPQQSIISGMQLIHVKVYGNLSKIDSVSYAYSQTSTACTNMNFIPLNYNSVDNYFEKSDGWNTLNLNEGQYYLCIRASFKDSNNIIINKNITINNYDFTLDPSTTGQSIVSNGVAQYQGTLTNIGERDTFTVSSSSTWTTTIKINGATTNTVTLNKGDVASLLITVTPPSNANIGDSATTTIKVTSSKGETKTFTITTTVSSHPNRAPTINNIVASPESVKQGSTITFSAEINDPDNDPITASVCKDQTCSSKYCDMATSGGIYSCSYTANDKVGTYNYFIKAVAGQSTISGSNSFTIIPANSCSQQSDCPDGQICKAGLCKVGCLNDNQCPSGQICLVDTCVAGCRESSQCPAGQWCSENRCTSSCTSTDQCRATYGADYICSGNVCKQGCLNDADCSFGVCYNNVCESRNVQILQPNTNVLSGMQFVHVSVSGSVNSVSYAYSQTSTSCTGASFKALSYNSIDKYYEDPSLWDTTKLTDGKYYFCVKAIYKDNKEIPKSQDVTINNYDFTLDPSTTGQSIVSNGVAEYNLTLQNLGLTDTYTISASQSADWSYTITINGIQTTSINNLQKDSPMTIKVRVTPPSGAQINDVMILTLRVTSSKGESKTSVITTTVSSYPRKPPVISNISSTTVKKGGRITFTAKITDPEGDPITASVCKDQSCSERFCTMTASGNSFSCEFDTSNSNAGTYDYYVYAQSDLTTVSSKNTFTILREDYCNTDNDCQTGQICKADVHYCTVGCSSDSDCPQGKICDPGTSLCVDKGTEIRYIRIIRPSGEVSGQVKIEVSVSGNIDTTSPAVTYSYSNISTACTEKQFKPLVYNPVDSIWEDPSLWDTTKLTDGKYYFCVKARYRDNQEIPKSQEVTINNYDFTFNSITASSSIRSNDSAVYEAILNNTGLSDTFNFESSITTGWTSKILINNIERNSTQLSSGTAAPIKIIVIPPSNATRGDSSLLSITIKTPHDNKNYIFTTIISSVPNKAPTINNVYHDPIKVRKGERLTFFANITDPENDNITTRMVCKDLNCTDSYCNIMAYSNGIYSCSNLIYNEPGTYNYYIYAKDSNNLSTKSDRYQFVVVEENYCENDNDCISGEKCIGKQCIAGGCKTDADCEGGKKCAPSGRCVECLSNSDCGNKKCDLTTSTCVECLQNSDCAGTDNSCGCSLITKKCQICPNNYKCQNYVCVFQTQNGTVETFSGGTRYPDGHIVPFTGVNPAPNAVDANNDGDYTDPTDDFNGNGIDNKNDPDPFKTGGDSSILIVVIAIVIAGVLGFVYFKYLRKTEEAILEKIQRERGY